MTVRNFPRGGRILEKNRTSLLTSKKTKSKRNRIKGEIHFSSKRIQKNNNLVNVAPNLRYSTISNGMIVLGCIFKVTDYYAIVSLPGQISGKLQATEISKKYTGFLKNIADSRKFSDEFKTITNLYKPGDYIICYIKEINFQTKQILLSTEPSLINEKLNPSHLTKCSKVVLTVSSIEDHGYVMETGLKNLRAFLSVKDVQNVEIELCIGKQIVCAVKYIEENDLTFTATVSLKTKHLKRVEPDTLSLDSYVPGAQYSLIIKQVLRNGLQVYFGKENIGYVNQFYLAQDISCFKEAQELIGTLLYVTPTTKIACFSLLSQEQEDNLISIGSFIPKAYSLACDSRGILIKLTEGTRGYIPLKRTEVDCGKIESVFSRDSIHKCRVIAYDPLAKLHICSMEQEVMTRRFTHSSDLEAGKIVNVLIKNMNQENGYMTVTFGKIFGTVPPDQVVDSGFENCLKLGDCVRARVLDSSRKIIFTLKKSLVESELPVLSTFENAKINGIHDGTVIKIHSNGVLVRFFDDVKGWIPKCFLKARKFSDNWNLNLGETITVVVVATNSDERKIILSLLNRDENFNYKIGDVLEGTVTDSSVEGIHMRIENDNNSNVLAYLPAGHISPCPEVSKVLSAKTVAGDKLTFTVFSTAPNLIVSTTFVPEKIYDNISSLNYGDIILCSVIKICKDFIKVLLPIKNTPKYGLIPINSAENIETMYKHQILFAKVTQAVGENQDIITLTSQFFSIWKDVVNPEIQMMCAVDVLRLYLNKVLQLSKNVSYANKSIAKVKIGQRIKGTVDCVMGDGLVIKLEGNLKGVVRKNNFFTTYNKSEEIEAVVLWINYANEYVELSLVPSVINNIRIKQNELARIPIGIQLRGEIVLVTNWFILVILKGKSRGTLVALPVRRHLNDIVPDLTPYHIGGRIRCYAVFNRDDVDTPVPICMVKSAFETYHAKEPFERSVVSEKRKVQKNDKEGLYAGPKRMKNLGEEDSTIRVEYGNSNEKNYTEKGTQEKDKKKNVFADQNNKNLYEKMIEIGKQSKSGRTVHGNIIKQNQECKPIRNETVNSLNSSVLECGFKWDILKSVRVIENLGDSETNAVEKEMKKLSYVGNHDTDEQKERHIRGIEEALNTCLPPQTVDEFDRLVLANPNSSLVWIQFMVYYLQVTDVEKARAVARRALKIINFREEEERLNVWKAWLNLESRFGCAESLDRVFQEALKTNNAEKVCTHMLTLHLDAQKYDDIEKLANIMLVKFKKNPDVWINCGTALLKIGQKDRSRNIMQRALQSLPEHRHIDLIVRFAVLENNFGDKERSQTLFESILEKYKNRTDIWSTYVDSLVKSGDVEIARKVLDRAVKEILSEKKMKILFKKYISFEKKYGSPENLFRVQELARNYVEKQCNNKPCV